MREIPSRFCKPMILLSCSLMVGFPQSLRWPVGLVYSAVSSSSWAGGGDSTGTVRHEQLLPETGSRKRTFAIIAVCTILTLIVSSVVLHLTITVLGAARSVSTILVAVTAIVFARRVVAAARRWGACTSSWRRTFAAAVATFAGVPRTIAARVESPRSRRGSSSPLKDISLRCQPCLVPS